MKEVITPARHGASDSDTPTSPYTTEETRGKGVRHIPTPRTCGRCGCTDRRTCEAHKGSEPGVWAGPDLCAGCTPIGHALPEPTKAELKGMTRGARRRAARRWLTSFYGRPDRRNNDRVSRRPSTRRWLLGERWRQLYALDEENGSPSYHAIRQRYELPHLVTTFTCPTCGPEVAADEDGCCAMCGEDCTLQECRCGGDL